MALVKCPDCSARISDSAPTCPKCGRPAGAPIKAMEWWANPALWRSLAVAVLAIIIIRACGSVSDDGDHSSSDSTAASAAPIPSAPEPASPAEMQTTAEASSRLQPPARTTSTVSAAASSVAPKISDADCRKSLECAGPKYQPYAETYCKPLIEAKAKYGAKWDSFFSPIFDTNGWGWGDKSHTSIVYAGEEVKFQNAYNVYMPMTYACTLNIKTLNVVDVKVALQ